MNTRRICIVFSLASVFAQLGCSTTQGQGNEISAQEKHYVDARYKRTDRKAFRKMAYASAGLGLSHLDPDDGELPHAKVNDRVNNGNQLTIGADLSRQLSIELQGTDLGSAGMSSGDRIKYDMVAASALLYAGKNRHRYRRTGLTAFGRFGVGKLETAGVTENVRLAQRNDTQFIVGAGVEYATRVGLGVRGEAISIDDDVRYAQLAVIYRLGRKRERQRPREIVAESPEPIEEPIVAAAIEAPEVPLDSDADGVFDDFDNCPNSAAGSYVDKDGCALFAGVIEGVNFKTSSADLTPEAQQILNSVAATLTQYPNVDVSVHAHTDSMGAAELNQSLSEARAESVVEYLSSLGIERTRLTPSAYGESQPIASNDTREGRARNRRVELFAER